MKNFLFGRGFILPVMVSGVIPTTLTVLTRAWERTSPALLAAGAIVSLAGLSLLIATTQMFARHRGSLAPWNPPKDMVSSGLYLRVRNPMILGIFHILAGEAIALRSGAIAVWLLIFVVAQHTYIVFDEEPLLVKRFGEPYERYRQQVPRWIPRLTPAASTSTNESTGS